MSQDEIDRMNRACIADGRKNFRVEVKLKEEWEGMDGDIIISFTRNGSSWQSFRLWKEEIDTVIEALQNIKEGESNGIQQGED